MLDDIRDFHKDDTAIDKEGAFIVMHNDVRCHRRMMKGWQLLCQWKDGSTNWVALKDMKKSYPVQVADYAMANHIDDEPAFAWWVPDVFKKCEQILSKVKTKNWQCTNKFGIHIPKSCTSASLQ